VSTHDLIRSVVLPMLQAGRGRSPLKDDIDDATPLLDVGLIDSARLLDIILEVETRCGVEFNPERIDSEKSITLGTLISAFDPVSS
jgi:acyl carrier protein